MKELWYDHHQMNEGPLRGVGNSLNDRINYQYTKFCIDDIKPIFNSKKEK